MRVVISQSMYFPWTGCLEQVRLADVFVHLDDVQFTRGFFNRVQVKTRTGVVWLTVPLRRHRQHVAIADVAIDATRDWQGEHRALLERAYDGAPYRAQMLALVDGVFAHQDEQLGTLARRSLLALCDYFGLTTGRRFVDARELGVMGTSSERILGLVRAVGGTEYVTGHGSRHYLDHVAFERAGIEVRYMEYQARTYPQFHGEFTPFVTGLDLVAHLGKAGANRIASGTRHWRDFLDGRSRPL